MKEIWKTINEYQEYQVSNTGKVKSIKYGKERILKSQNVNGYKRVILFRDGKYKNMYIHQLVAEAFIQNTDNFPQVNHRNEIKTDNRVENLEFCDRKYNMNFGTRTQRASKTKSKPVRCIETNVVYPSAKEVKRQLGFVQSSICNCCNGKYKQAYGFHWEYVD